MTSHGVARASRPRTEEQRQIDLDRIQRYRDLDDQLRDKASRKEYDQDAFQLTSKLLRLNPEYYTVWNTRRRCLVTSGSSSAPSAGSWPSKGSPSSSAIATRTSSSAESLPSSSIETPLSRDSQTTGKSGTTAELEPEQPPAWTGALRTIKDELEFTVPLLMQFPKCYWLWNHRLWVLNEAIERLPVAAARKIWETELGLIGKMLDKDRRNFHAWGYRRFVVEKLESQQLGGSTMVEPEFEYSTKMVHANLSNFSAWHYRSQLIPRLLAERGADAKDRRAFLEKELAFVRDALNVGPEDQSLWFYQQYLISDLLAAPNAQTIAPSLTDDERKAYIEKEIEEIKDLLEDYTDIKWIYEALIGYTDSISGLSGGAERAGGREETRVWLSKLRELDPGREGRWLDLERRLALS